LIHLQQQQFLNLLVLLFLGSFFSNIYLSCWEIAVVFLFTITVEWGISDKAHPTLAKRSEGCRVGFSQHNASKIPYSSLSTAIGIMLMMVSTHLYIYLLVIALALLQKKYLQIERQHFFNPSNFALIMALFLFYNDAHIVLGQLGHAFWLASLLFLMALLILVRVERWLIPLFFILFYLLFQYLLLVRLDPMLIMEDIYYRFYSISFILFVLFMLTDPRTTPDEGFLQILFAFCIALLSSVLDYINGFRVQHLFLALFALSFWIPLIRLGQSQKRKRAIWTTILLFFLVTVVIMSIENQAPYYFSMDN
jgi:hypothetical protein